VETKEKNPHTFGNIACFLNNLTFDKLPKLPINPASFADGTLIVSKALELSGFLKQKHVKESISMTEPQPDAQHSSNRRFRRDTIEFSRVVNLSDGVFAIVMTLLIFTLVTPDTANAWSIAALLAHIPQLIVVMLSFALVANLWWQHHKFFEMIRSVEPGLIAINLLLLGAVALVPFPTNIVGKNPFSRAAVLPFIVISFLDMLLLIRARKINAWRQPISTPYFYWLLAAWVMGIVVMVISFILALWMPLAGLIVLAVSITLGPLAAGIGHITLFSSESKLSRYWQKQKQS
jgi:uncharacterized membrane protein